MAPNSEATVSLSYLAGPAGRITFFSDPPELKPVAKAKVTVNP